MSDHDEEGYNGLGKEISLKRVIKDTKSNQVPKERKNNHKYGKILFRKCSEFSFESE